MTTLQQVELGVLGPLQVRQYGLPVSIPGAKPRAILTMLGLHGGSVVPADTLVALLWGDDPPRTAAKALQTHISSLRRSLGDGFVLTQGTGWTLSTTEIDATRYKSSATAGRAAAASGDTSQAVARFDEALVLWRGTPELPGGQRGISEKTRWIEGHAALVEDRADALLATGRAAEIIGDLEAAIADAPLRERRWGQLMLALYRAGRQGEALGAYQRARSLLADELGVDPGPDLRRLEAAIVAQDDALEMPVSPQLTTVTRAVTFLLTDIEGSTAAWEADADAMAAALARHDELVEQVVTSRGGRLIKTRGEGDATFSVFDRPSAAATAAIELQEAIRNEPWALSEPMRIRVSLHTGEVEFRDGDYFGRAVNRAARLRSLATGGQILCSGATAELIIDSLSDDVILTDLGMRQLRNLARPEHVFELRLQTAEESRAVTPDAPIERPALPAVLAGPGPFVGRRPELERLLSTWQTALDGGAHAVLIAGEPGVGKTRLAGEWSQHAYEQGAVVLYGRCDEDLGAPYQPFAEALRSLIPCLGTSRLRGLRGVEALLPLVPGLTDVLPDLSAPTRADPDTERYALFDAVVAVLGVASTSAPVVLILDDLHWAAKSTLLLLRHLLRFGEHTRVQIVGTYRSTDLDRSHPLAAMLADLHRDGSATRLQLSGLDEVDVSAYLAEAGYDDEELARALASVTGGNPFFLIEALRHVDESGGRWDPSTLPQGVREAVSRRLSRLPEETNKALAAAAVVGSRFALELVERIVGDDLVDAFDEASKAGIVIEEPGGRYRFNHAIVRQSLLAELASVRRMRLHQRIAATLETEPGADDELLAELAHHYFECAWAGNAAKAVEYCRRAADQAMARLAYEGAADLYDRAVHALEEVDEELPDRDDQQAELLVARCEALLAAGDVVSAAGAVSQLQAATRDSARLGAWGTCFDGQLSMLTDPERLDEIESAVAAAAEKLAGLDDPAGEAMAHTVRAICLGRLGRIGDCETALDHALTAARRAKEHRRVNAVLAGAPLAALWGPNPVPRAGGRCLDVVRLLRITTGSPVVEATSTRCQAVLDALRGRAAAGRSLLDSARRALTELGMRHALLEVDQFAGILELVADDPAAAEPHLRRAYNGFRRMGLDADTAETAALLARACLTLDRDAEADELCTESERLAGHALKASIAWRTVRAQLLARGGAHGEARRVAEEAVAVAERTDFLVDHGDACLALATVLQAAGDSAGAQAAAEKAIALYELKGAAALAEKARKILGAKPPAAPTAPETPTAKLDNACVRVIHQTDAAFDRGAWDECDQFYAPNVYVESRRKMVGFTQADLPSGDWPRVARHLREGWAWHRNPVIAVRGEHLALTRLELGTDDVSPGAPHEEFLGLWGLDEDSRIALQVFFDIDDLDAAIAELDAAHARLEERQARAPLENAASRADARLNALFAERRFDEIGALFADDIRVEDRRRGLRHEGNDRAFAVAQVRAIADIGTKSMTSDVLAIRGERLALVRTLHLGRDQRPEAFHTELFRMVEIDADERIVAHIAFDIDDIDAAIAELDARYLAGEAAPYLDTWSVIAGTYAEFNRHGLVPDWVSVDHRRGSLFASSNLNATIRAARDLTPDLRIYIETVHRLSHYAAVVTNTSFGSSHEGFAAEWRMVQLLTVEGDRISRLEIFDEADIDAALARFDRLTRPTQRLDNAANRVLDSYLAHFPGRDWDGMADMLADSFSADDRRRVVNAGVRSGRDAEIANVQVIAEIGCAAIASTPIATRGERLVLTRQSFTGADSPESFHTDILGIVEIDADNRISTHVIFNPDDIDAAFAELDARYLAGEAKRHARTWSVITQGYVAANRGELAATAPDVVNIDHRQLAMIDSGELVPYLRDTFDELANISTYLEAVHQLTDRGAVVTHVGAGTSKEGFDAEWRMINVIVVDGDLISRTEMFDEVDIDAAIAHFDELSRPAPQLGNAASRVNDRLLALYAARDWTAMADILREDAHSKDRRRPVNADLNGRDAVIEGFRSAADLGVPDVTSIAVATRAERLVLTRARYSLSDKEGDAFHLDVLQVVEVDADERIAAVVVFDLDDTDAAFEELETRYLAEEAARHAHTWTVMVDAFAALNRHEVPETIPDYIIVDHRLQHIEKSGLTETLRTTWDLTPDFYMYIEAVHLLTDLGAVITLAVRGTSNEGFDAEWRMTEILTREGDLGKRCEVFDESDVDAALARFDELSRPTPQLENTASDVYGRFWTCFAARDWVTMAELFAEGIRTDDRRRVVNAGVQHGRDAAIADMRAVAELWNENMTTTVSATRGSRLALSHVRSSATQTELLNMVEIDADNQITSLLAFDLDDIEAAIAELDARYLAGEGAAHAHIWSVIARARAALVRHELPPTTPDWVNVDHRRGGIAFSPGDMTALFRAMWDLQQDFSTCIEAVHRLNDVGAVFTQVARGTSHEGFDAEWRIVEIMTAEGDLISRAEFFDESDLDAALARFDRLTHPGPRLENAASRAYEPLWTHFAARDWDAIADTVARDIVDEDRRRVVNAGIRHGRDALIANMRAIAEVGVESVTSSVVATRGERLALNRVRFSMRRGEVSAEVLNIAEIDTDDRVAASIQFDLDDIDAAFEELDARYLAGEAAPYSDTWSVITRNLAAFNRGESSTTTPDWVTIDHRRVARFAPEELSAAIRDSTNTTPELRARNVAVHRLSDCGAIVTTTSHGTSPQGFEAEWKVIQILTIDTELISRCELFDESDLDVALARFDELSRPAPRLENAVSRAYERAQAYIAARNWIAVAETLTEDLRVNDRRPVVGAGVRHGRDEAIADMRATSDLGITKVTSAVIATRGERLMLVRARHTRPDQGSDAFHTEVLGLYETNADGRIAAVDVFGFDDIDAAFEELDARYLAGEAAPYSDTWSVITRGYAALNRREIPATSQDWVNIDHRRSTTFEPGDLPAYIRALWDVASDVTVYVETVHRVSDFGALVSSRTHGRSHDGFDAEWPEINLLTVDGDRISRCEIFEEADVDKAIARFDELSRPAPQLANTASRVYERFWAHYATRDWDAMAELFAEDIRTDDRRRVVNAGVQHGRDVQMADMRSLAGIEANVVSTIIATRGERLCLNRVSTANRDVPQGEFDAEMLSIIEIDADSRIAAGVLFDLDDIDAAFAELDARYAAGEAAAYAHTWSVMAQAFAASNRREMPEFMPDFVNIDHRRARGFAPGDLTAYMRATWDLAPDVIAYAEAAHQLSNLGAVFTQAVSGTSQDGFEAEWREIVLATVDGNLINRIELFEEADLDAALARFDELSQSAPQLENAASRVNDRLLAHFNADNWDDMSEILADEYFSDDRRHVPNVGVREGRDVAIANMRKMADLGITFSKSYAIATRGARLALSRVRWSGRDQRPEEFHTDVVNVVEINADERVTARVWFDADDLDAAFAELDARYVAGEAAPYSDMWSVIVRGHAAFNRREFPTTTPDWVNIDHRRGRAFAPGDLFANWRAVWDLVPDIRIYIEAVHRLSALGAVVTHGASGTSQEGFDAEWREIDLLTFEGDRLSRCELFDEADIDAAIARFDELSRPVLRLENAASRAYERLNECFPVRDWDALAEILADDISSEDRRRVVNAGLQQGRDAVIAEISAVAEVGVKNVTTDTIATRGERLVLSRGRWAGHDPRPEAFRADALDVVEIDGDGRVAARVVFDPDDLDAAFAELDARYLAGEGAAHAHTWSVIAGAYAAMNRHELPAMTTDWIHVDHRPLITIEPSDPATIFRAAWDLVPDLSIHIESVHRLSDLGAVFTQAAHGTTQAGFDAEWRIVELVTVGGDLMNRGELFEESDLDAALARLDELGRPTPRLENAASRAYERMLAYFGARDWAAMAETIAKDILEDDRRRVVNAGVRQGRDALIANMRATAEVGVESMTLSVVATRGERLALSRVRSSRHGEVGYEVITIVAIDADNRIVAGVEFDAEDINAAFEELDARYLAGEAAASTQTWSVIIRATAAFNRRELPAGTPNRVDIDHRHGASFAPGELSAYLRSTWDFTPEATLHIEAVHGLNNLGAVVTHVAQAISPDGFAAEWRVINVLTVEGDLISGCEVFDETDLDAALTRFDELSAPVSRLNNAASQAYERFWTSFAARDWTAFADLLAADIVSHDRRRVVNGGILYGRDAEIADKRILADLGVTTVTPTAIATRGERLVLNRVSSSTFQTEVINVVEVGADGRIVAIIGFSSDDIDAAFAELDARYLANEAAQHSQTWSVITGVYTSFNRQEFPATTQDWVGVDHRLLLTIEAGDMAAFNRAVLDQMSNLSIYMEAVHRLTDRGAVVSHVAHGVSKDGFDAEWRIIFIFAVEGSLISRYELFDEADLDAALARFDALSRPAPRLENAASQAVEQFCANFAARDWTAMAGIVAQNIIVDDRRRVVGAGSRHGREAEIENLRVWADIGIKHFKSNVIAIRGRRLALCRARWSGSNLRSQEFYSEALGIVEINADNQITSRIMLDPDNLEAAVEDLDARYLAGEAAAYSRTWSVIARSNAAFNRRELPSAAPDWVTIDHRRGASFEPGDLTAYIRSGWDIAPDSSVYIESVHRVSDLGAVVTQISTGTSQQGFEAEWRFICLLTVDGEFFSGCELFDEADLDAAVARFDELNLPAPRLENAASRVLARVWAYFAARDWDAIAETMAEDFSSYDHRRVVNAGVRRGRDIHITNMRAVTDVGFENVGSTVIATRGQRLALSRTHSAVRGMPPDEVGAEATMVVEIDADNRLAVNALFDLDDIDAAFAELDDRYLAGEAAAHARTWSVVKEAYAAFNRRELPPSTPDWVNIDHRRGARFAPGDAIPYIRAAWDVAPDINIEIEVVHQLRDLGAVVTQVSKGASQQGFDAEWREIALLTFAGKAINRCEIFDEADLDVALARFDELSQPVPSLENIATRTWARIADAFNRRDMEGALALTAADGRYEDRRKGLRDKGTARDVWQTVFDAPRGWRLEMEPVAIRGSRLGLTRGRFRDTDYADRPITVEYLTVTGVGDDDLMHDTVIFDLDDIDTAFEELDARYLAGEAAAHARTWSVVKEACAAFNRRELPATTPDWVNIDHRRGAGIAPGDAIPYIRAMWEVTPDVNIYIEAVHRLNSFGAVVTHVSKGTSQQGFDAEWRVFNLVTVEGDLINRCEVFDEADLDAALTRFDELSRPASQLENAATRVFARMMDTFNRRDLDSFLSLVTADGRYEDRRKGLRDEGPIRPDFARALFIEAAPSWQEETEPFAIRGPRLVLCRLMFRDHSEVDRPIAVEALVLTEVTDDELTSRLVIFDPDDIDGAMAELTSRWIASGEVAHPEVIEMARRLNEAVNRDDWEAFATSNADATFVNHRQLSTPDVQTIADYLPSMRMAASLIPTHRVEIADILTHSTVGLVIHLVLQGTSTEGFAAELPVLALILLDGERVTHLENFDLEQRDLALARFEELNRPS